MKRFIAANFPYVEYSHSRTKRAAWISARGVTTKKPRKSSLRP